MSEPASSSHDETQEFRYSAFISYRHVQADSTWAQWLHRALETYRVPAKLQSAGYPPRLGKLFKDNEELNAASDLSEAIQGSLRVSRFLIVICSRNTPASPWVDREIQFFRQLGRSDRILAFLIDGEPDEAFPESLCKVANETDTTETRAVEPLAADVRPLPGESKRLRRRHALLRIAARLLGCGFDDLRQRDAERRRQRLFRAGLVASFLTVLLLAGAIFAAIYFKKLADSERQANEDKEIALKGEKIANEDRRQKLERLNVREGLRRIEDGDLFGALPWLVEGLRQALSRPDGADPVSERMHRLRIAALLWQCPKLVHQNVLKGRVDSACWTADGRRLVVVAPNEEFIWDLEKEKSSNLPKRAYASLSACSPVTSQFALARSRTISVHNLETGDELRTLKDDGANSFKRLAYSADGKRLLAADERSVRVWDVERGKVLTEPMRFSHEGLQLAALSADGKLVLTVSGNLFKDPLPLPNAEWANRAGNVQVWKADTGKPWRTYDGRDGAALSPGGKSLALVNFKDKSIDLWELESNRKTLSFRVDGPGAANHVAFSPDGKRLLVRGGWNPSEARVWAVAREKGRKPGEAISAPIRLTDRLYEAAFSPDGRMVMTLSEDGIGTGSVQLWDSDSGQAVTPPLRQHAQRVRAAFSPDARRLLVYDNAGTVRVWDLATGIHLPVDGATARNEELGRFRRLTGTLLIRRQPGPGDTIRVYDAASDRAVSPWLRHPDPVAGLDVSPDGRWLATSTGGPFSDDEPGEIRVWEIETGKLITGPIGLSDSVQRIRFGLDGKRLLVMSSKQALLWDIPEGKLRASLRMKQEKPDTNSASMSRDGRRILTWGSFWERETNARMRTHGYAQLWDADTAEPIGPPLKHGEDVSSAVLSPDGQLIATIIGGRSDSQRSVRVWQVSSGKPLTPLLLHRDPINQVEFSDDGRMLFTVSGSTARVWDAHTGEPRTAWLPHRSPLRRARLDRADQILLTSFDVDSLAGVWDIATSEPILSLPSRLDRKVLADDRNLPLETEPDTVEGLLPPPSDRPRRWPATGEGRSLDQLTALARLLDGRRLDGMHGPVPLDLNALREVWEQSRQSAAAEFRPSPADAVRWHATQVELSNARQRNLPPNEGGDVLVFHLGQLVQLEPKNPHHRQQRGIALLRTGRFARAVEDFEAALSLRKDSVEAWHGRASAQIKLGQWELAGQALDEAVKLRPEDAQIRGERGQVRAHQKKWQEAAQDYFLADINGAPSSVWEEALALFSRAVKEEPGNGWAWFSQGLALLVLEKRDEAVVALDRAIALGPKDWRVWYIHALTRSKPEERLKSVDAAIAAGADLPDVWMEKGLALAEMEKHADALRELTRAIKRGMPGTGIWHERGLCQADLKQWKLAEADYTEAINRGLDTWEIWNQRGLALLKQERFSEAIEDLSRAIRRIPFGEKIWYPWVNRGYCLARLGRGRQALSDYEKADSNGPVEDRNWNQADEAFTLAIKSNPSDSWNWIGRARARFSLKQWGPAAQDYTEALKRHAGPERVDLVRNRGICYFHLGDWTSAEQNFTRVLESGDRHADADWQTWYQRGAARMNLKNFDGAIKDLTAAINRRADDWRVWFERGRAHFFKGQMDLAFEDLTTVLEQFKIEDPQPWLVRGIIQTQRKQWKDAEKDYSAAIERKAEGPIAYAGRGKTRFHLNHWQDAIGDFSVAIERKTADTDVWFQRSLCRMHLIEWKKAEEDLTFLIDQAKDKSSGVRLLRASVRMELDRPKDAVKDTEVALKTEAASPENWAVHLLVVDQARGREAFRRGCIEALKKLKDAKDVGSVVRSIVQVVDSGIEPKHLVGLALKSAEAKPADVESGVVLAAALVRARQWERAVTLLEPLAVRQGNEDGRIRLWLALARHGQGKSAEATKLLGAAVAWMAQREKETNPDRHLNWMVWRELRLLREEVERLLKMPR